MLPDALQPGPSGSWDDLATWTGSIVAERGRFHLFYTGVDRDRCQRIGVAMSEDLISWCRESDHPLLEASGPWYATPANASRSWTDWRDPCVSF